MNLGSPTHSPVSPMSPGGSSGHHQHQQELREIKNLIAKKYDSLFDF